LWKSKTLKGGSLYEEYANEPNHVPRFNPLSQMMFPATHLSDFVGDILVICSRCSNRAHLLRITDAQDRHDGHRLICPDCGLVREWRLGKAAKEGIPSPSGGPILVGFDVALWLQTRCCGETLWAYNLPHVEFLDSYVAATLRGHRRDPKFGWSNQSIQSRLPGWMLDGHHREDVLAGLSRLRSAADLSSRP